MKRDRYRPCTCPPVQVRDRAGRLLMTLSVELIHDWSDEPAHLQDCPQSPEAALRRAVAREWARERRTPPVVAAWAALWHLLLDVASW